MNGSEALRLAAEAVSRSVRELVIPHAGSHTPPMITVSVGKEEGPASLVELADLALYDAKAGGRNRVAVRG